MPITLPQTNRRLDSPLCATEKFQRAAHAQAVVVGGAANRYTIPGMTPGSARVDFRQVIK